MDTENNKDAAKALDVRDGSAISPMKRLIRACGERDKARKMYAFFSKTRDKVSAESWQQKLREANAECDAAQREVWLHS